jgi:hypothetical protein
MLTPKPKPGTDVHLVVLEHSAYRYAKPTWVLDGTVVDKFWWENDPQAVCLVVPGSEVPTRVVRMDHIVSIDGELVRGWDRPASERVQTWRVESNSRPQIYTVTYDGSEWKCECKGFAYHRHCSHIKQIQEKHGLH